MGADGPRFMSNALIPHLQLMHDKIFNAGDGFDLEAEAYEAERSMTSPEERGAHCFPKQARILHERAGLDEKRFIQENKRLVEDMNVWRCIPPHARTSWRAPRRRGAPRGPGPGALPRARACPARKTRTSRRFFSRPSPS